MLKNIYRIPIVYIAHKMINLDGVEQKRTPGVVSRQSHRNKLYSKRPYGTQGSCVRLISFLVNLQPR